MKRSLASPEITKFNEKFEDFVLIYFCENYDRTLFEKWEAVINEIEIYFKDGLVGGYSSGYCYATWNDETMENEADLKVFDLLFEIDVQNGADPTKIAWNLCLVGAFEAVKVKTA